MSKVRINGVTVSTSERGSVVILNGRVIVDGKDLTPDAKEISITVEGNVEKVEADACQKISVTGEVGNVKTMSGMVEINGNIKGSVQTMLGDVECESIAGSVSTMSGSIRQRS